MNLHKKKMKSYSRTLFGVAYVSRVENQAKRSSYSLFIFLKFLVMLDRARVH